MLWIIATIPVKNVVALSIFIGIIACIAADTLLEPMPALAGAPDYHEPRLIKLYGDELTARFDERHRKIRDSIDEHGYSLHVSELDSFEPEREGWLGVGRQRPEAPDGSRYQAVACYLIEVEANGTKTKTNIFAVDRDSAFMARRGRDRVHTSAEKIAGTVSFHDYVESLHSRPRGIARLKAFGRKILGLDRKSQSEERPPSEVIELPIHVKTFMKKAA